MEKQNVEGLQDSQFAEDIHDIRNFSIKLQELIVAQTNAIYNNMALIDLKLKEEGVLTKELENFHPSGMMYNSSPPFMDRLNFVLANIAVVNNTNRTELNGICSVINKIDRELNAAGVETLSTRDHSAWDNKATLVNRTLRRRFHSNPLVRHKHKYPHMNNIPHKSEIEVKVFEDDGPSTADNQEFITVNSIDAKNPDSVELPEGDFVAPVDASLESKSVPSSEVTGTSFIKKSHKKKHDHVTNIVGHHVHSAIHRRTALSSDSLFNVHGHKKNLLLAKPLFPNVVDLDVKDPVSPNKNENNYSFLEKKSESERPVNVSPWGQFAEFRDPFRPILQMRTPLKPVVDLRDPLKPVVDLRDPLKPVFNLIDPLKPVVNMRDPLKPVLRMKDPKRPVVRLRDPLKPVLRMKDPKRPVVNMRDPLKPVLRMKDPKRPVVRLRDPLKPILRMKDPKRPVVRLKDPKRPIVQMRDPLRPVVEMRDPLRPIIKMRDPLVPLVEMLPAREQPVEVNIQQFNL